MDAVEKFMPALFILIKHDVSALKRNKNKILHCCIKRNFKREATLTCVSTWPPQILFCQIATTCWRSATHDI